MKSASKSTPEAKKAPPARPEPLLARDVVHAVANALPAKLTAADALLFGVAAVEAFRGGPMLLTRVVSALVQTPAENAKTLDGLAKYEATQAKLTDRKRSADAVPRHPSTVCLRTGPSTPSYEPYAPKFPSLPVGSEHWH